MHEMLRKEYSYLSSSRLYRNLKHLSVWFLRLIPKYYSSKTTIEQSHLGTNEIIYNTANEIQKNMCHGKVGFIQRIQQSINVTQYIRKCITVNFFF